LRARHAVRLIKDDVYGEIHFTRERLRPFVALDGGANTMRSSWFRADQLAFMTAFGGISEVAVQAPAVPAT
jgi:hypothetical protein